MTSVHIIFCDKCKRIQFDSQDNIEWWPCNCLKKEYETITSKEFRRLYVKAYINC